MRADNPHTTTSIDPTALAATQIVVQFHFGPTSVPVVTCPNPTTYLGTSVCASFTTFAVPAGNRLVITNISGNITYNPNGGTEVIYQGVDVGLNVNGTIAFSTIPFDHIQLVGTTTYFSFNRSVHMFADPATNHPEVLIPNLTGGQPLFQMGVGAANIVFQGYLVPTN